MKLNLGKRCLAAIALFGEFVKKNFDVYMTLSIFIKYIIYDKKLKSFSTFDITRFLFSYFEFSVPEIVVSNALKRIPELMLANKLYTVKKSIVIEVNIAEEKKNKENNYKFIIDQLIDFVQQKIKRSLGQGEIEKINNILFEYLIHDNIAQDYFGKYVASFIVEKKQNNLIVEGLNIIKEGVLLYSAFQYTPEEYSNNTWNTELVLYFDTELLFSLYGYNGELYQKIVKELLDLIQSINKSSLKKTNKKIIHLRYFVEIESEINSFFNTAERNIINNKNMFQTKIAMRNIMNGCNDISEIREKKGIFWAKIHIFEFECDHSDYFEEKYNQFNILNSDKIRETIDNYDDYSQDEIEMNMNILNKINILRSGRNDTLRNAKYVFLTATKLCLDIARQSSGLREGAVPFSSTCEYFTNMLWIKINRNFASINIKSIDIVARAQIVVASLMNIAIDKKVREVQKRFDNGQVTREEADAVLSEIRKYRDDNITINEDSIERIVVFTEEGIDTYIDNFNYQINKTHQLTEQNTILSNENSKLINSNDKKDAKIKEYEEKEKNRLVRRFRFFYILKTILLFIFSLGFICLSIYISSIEINVPNINYLLSAIGLIGTILGILRFFGLDFKTIKGKILKLHPEKIDNDA